MTSVPEVTLSDGRTMPRLGFGTYPLNDAETRAAVGAGLGLGYRLIDTASAYDNETGVGEGIADAAVPREEIFVSTMLRGAQQGYEETPTGLHESLDRLGLDYVDLYLIHWPLPRQGRYLDSWRALIRLRDQGLAKSIGVSNFTPPMIEHLVAETGVKPVVNQVELHPTFSQAKLRDWDSGQDIVTQSYAPFGRGRGGIRRPEVIKIAKAHDRTPGQVVLRWHVQLGAVPIPKSSHPERMAQNLDVFGFELSDGEMAQISGLESGDRMFGDPDVHEEF